LVQKSWSDQNCATLTIPLVQNIGQATIAEAFGCLGVHNCAWNANPYMEHYAALPSVAYVDMGIKSDLKRARETFPASRRAIMYTPMDAFRSCEVPRTALAPINISPVICIWNLLGVEHTI